MQQDAGSLNKGTSWLETSYDEDAINMKATLEDSGGQAGRLGQRTDSGRRSSHVRSRSCQKRSVGCFGGIFSAQVSSYVYTSRRKGFEH